METDYYEIVGIVLPCLGVGILAIIHVIKGGSLAQPEDKSYPFFFDPTKGPIDHFGRRNLFPTQSSISPARRDQPPITTIDLIPTVPTNTNSDFPRPYEPGFVALFPHEAHPPLYISLKQTSDH